jgi:hypothetical protein
VAAWPVATALLLIVCAGLVAWARGRAGAASLETFLVRAGTRSALSASAFTLDYRGAALAYRAAQPGSARFGGGVRVPVPAWPRAALAWRDLTALTREPARLAWAALVGAGATLLALDHPGNVAIAGLVAGCAYAAATLLCEPLRIDVDHPDRSRVLLSWPFARVLVGHCLVPACALWTIVAAAIAGGVAAGLAGPGALLLIPTLAVALVAVAVLAVALASRRGGRIDLSLLSRLLTTDPSNPASAMIAVLLVAPWLILTLVAIGAPVAILGHAVAGSGAVVGAGVAATAIAVGTAAGLAVIARRSAAGS